MKVLTIENPSALTFNIITNAQGKQRFITRVSTKAGNRLQIVEGENANEFGLYVPPATVPKAISRFPLTWSGNARGQDSGESRRVLQVSSVGMGIIHLDMQLSGTGTIATLPDNAPTPTSLVEMQLDNGSIYIDGGSRNIIATSGVQMNKRYIVDMVGFFG